MGQAHIGSQVGILTHYQQLGIRNLSFLFWKLIEFSKVSNNKEDGV